MSCSTWRSTHHEEGKRKQKTLSYLSLRELPRNLSGEPLQHSLVVHILPYHNLSAPLSFFLPPFHPSLPFSLSLSPSLPLPSPLSLSLPLSEHQYFIVAYSSVLCSDMPPLEDYERSQVHLNPPFLPPSVSLSACTPLVYIPWPPTHTHTYPHKHHTYLYTHTHTQLPH